MRWLLAILLLFLLLSLSSILAFNQGLFHRAIQVRLESQLGVPIELGPVSLAWRWPLQLQVGPSQLAVQGLSFKWKSLQLEVLAWRPPYSVRVYLNSPVVTAASVEKLRQDIPISPAAPQKGAAFHTLPEVGYELIVEAGVVDFSQFVLRDLNLSLKQKLLLRSAAQLNLRGLVGVSQVPGELPVTLSGDNLTLSLETLKAVNLNATFAGLNAQVNGSSFLLEDRHQWSVALQVPDLSLLPRPPHLIPAKNWRGSVNLKAELSKSSSPEGWHGEGQLLVHGLSADVNWSHPAIQLLGPISADVDSAFSVSANKLIITSLRAKADLRGASTHWSGYFDKPAGTPLAFKIEAGLAADQILNVGEFWLQLGTLEAGINGKLVLNSPWKADLRVALPKVALVGLGKWILPLQKISPTGEMSLLVRFLGDLADPARGRFLIESLRLKNFAADVHQQTNQLTLSGPVRSSVEVNGEIDQGLPRRLSALGIIDLKSAVLGSGPLRKEAGREFNMSFKLKSAHESLNIENLSLKTYAADLGVIGQVALHESPKLKLKLNLKGVNLGELRKGFPFLRDSIPQGELSGELALDGRVSLDDKWLDWPLKVSGHVDLKVPEYVWVQQSSGNKENAEDSVKKYYGAPSVGGLLPKGALTERLNLKTAVDLGVVKIGKLEAQKLTLRGHLGAGRWRGEAILNEIFAGRVGIRDFTIPLFEAFPRVRGLAVWKNLTVEKVLEFLKPDFKSFATGKSEGQAEFDALLTGQKDFLSTLKLAGKARFEPITLNGLKIGEMINALLKKIPIPVSPVKVEPLHGRLQAEFNLASGVIQLPVVHAQDRDGSELNVKGKALIPSMQGDFVGVFAWTQSPFKGCVQEGNADAQGRLLMPLAIKGDLLRPDMTILVAMAEKIAARALDCEKKKLVQKIKKNGTKAIEKEAKKLLQDIFGK